MSDWQHKNSARSFQDALASIKAAIEAQRQPGETTEDTMRRLGMLKGYFARSTTYRLPKPPSVNSCYRNVTGSGRAKTARYRAWARAAGNEITAQGRVKYPGKVQVTMTVPFRSNADLDNLWKPSLDLLTEMQIIADDNMACVVRLVAEIGPEFTLKIEDAT